MNQENLSRRKAPRIPRRERIFVRIVGSDRHPELNGTIARCITSDLSSGGLRLVLDYPVEVDSLLDLWVKVPEHPGTFLLTGRVRWFAAGELEEERILGVELVTDGEAELDDRSDWTGLLDALARQR